MNKDKHGFPLIEGNGVLYRGHSAEITGFWNDYAYIRIDGRDQVVHSSDLALVDRKGERPEMTAPKPDIASDTWRQVSSRPSSSPPLISQDSRT